MTQPPPDDAGSERDVASLQLICSEHGLGTLLSHLTLPGGTHQVNALWTTHELSPFVVKLAFADRAGLIAAAVQWAKHLASIGVPIAPILHAGHTRAGAPAYMVMPLLPGDELRTVVDRLSFDELRRVAQDWIRIQRTVAEGLPVGGGYGLAETYSDPDLSTKWIGFLDSRLHAAAEAVKARGVVAERWSATLSALLLSSRTLLDGIAPNAFLDDLCHKNFLIHGGRITTVLDVDVIAFGDYLYALGQAVAGLVRAGHSTAFVHIVCTEMRASKDDVSRLRLYSGIFLLEFLGKFGRLDREGRMESVDLREVSRLCDALDALIA
jgi:hypothetical protein